MPVKYIGRKSGYSGKFLFEILGQLKNFGVGRIVVRDSINKRYPEPSYYRITKAFPKLDDPERKRGLVHATQVFRGRQLVEEQVVTTGYTPDWRLVSREDEPALVQRAAQAARAAGAASAAAESPRPPASVEMPPLLEALYIARLQRSGAAAAAQKPLLQLQFRPRPLTTAVTDAEHAAAAPGLQQEQSA